MKKILFVLFGAMVMLGLSLTGCEQNPAGEKATTKSEAEEQQKIVERVVQQLENLSMQAENTLIEAIQGIPTARGLLRSSTLGTLGITRSVEGEETLTSEEEDIIWESLTEEEQNQVLLSAEIYAEEFLAVELPMVFYKGLPEGVVETEDTVTVGEDMVFSKRTPEGLTAAYALASEYYEEGTLTTRGVASWAIPKWRSGKVNRRWYKAVVTYTFGGTRNKISTNHEKNMVRNAMARWENGSGMSLKFQEDTRWTRWDNFKYIMGWYKVVKIHKDPNVLGQAIPGRLPWSYCRLNPSVFTSSNYHTIVHELGHVLGLMHEFDRNDAHNYITWKSQEDKKVMAPWIARITYYNIGVFDYNSIMNYPDYYYKKGTTTTPPYLHYPSYRDFASIKSMYRM